MTADPDLARLITEAVTETDGVTAVFPVRAILHAATEGIASALDIPAPDVLVDVDRSDDTGTVTVTAHIGASAGRPTPKTLAAAAAAVKAAVSAEGVENSMVFVKARLIAKPEPDSGTL